MESAPALYAESPTAQLGHVKGDLTDSGNHGLGLKPLA